MSRTAKLASLAFCALLSGGCSDDGATDARPLKDQSLKDGSAADQPGLPDLVLPDGSGQCTFQWQTALSPQKKTATGTVTTTDLGGGVKQTVIDASAGGSASLALTYPYVYFAFKNGGSKISLDDFAARNDTTWDLALRRSILRVNGGDSGSGQAAVATIANSTLSQVTSIPSASSFITDDFLDANCVIKENDAGYPWTAFCGTSGRWYDFDSTTMKVKPKPDAYVVKAADGKTYYKVVITSWYSSTNPSEGGHYTIQWASIQ